MAEAAGDGDVVSVPAALRALSESGGGKVQVHFRAAGSAPIMKKNKFMVKASHPFSHVVHFLRRTLKYKEGDSLVRPPRPPPFGPRRAAAPHAPHAPPRRFADPAPRRHPRPNAPTSDGVLQLGVRARPRDTNAGALRRKSGNFPRPPRSRAARRDRRKLTPPFRAQSFGVGGEIVLNYATSDAWG